MCGLAVQEKQEATESSRRLQRAVSQGNQQDEEGADSLYFCPSVCLSLSLSLYCLCVLLLPYFCLYLSLYLWRAA